MSLGSARGNSYLPIQVEYESACRALLSWIGLALEASQAVPISSCRGYGLPEDPGCALSSLSSADKAPHGAGRATHKCAASARANYGGDDSHCHAFRNDSSTPSMRLATYNLHTDEQELKVSSRIEKCTVEDDRMTTIFEKKSWIRS